MTMPYKVEVKSKGNQIVVTVHPQPEVTNDKYLGVVTGHIQGVILRAGSGPNSRMRRAKLKRELIRYLQDFHDQQMIKPREEDEESFVGKQGKEEM